MLAAGDLRELVIIEVPVETRNDLGESVQTWEHFARRRASIEALSYTEQNRRQQVGGSVSHMVRMRYLEGLTGVMRLRWSTRGGRLLYITSVVERNNREEHELMCEEQAT
jgi:head-tail adaptor